MIHSQREIERDRDRERERERERKREREKERERERKRVDLGVDPKQVDLSRLKDLKSSGVGFTWRSRLEVEFRIEK